MNVKTIWSWSMISILAMVTMNANAAITVYTDEAAYIEALSSGGYATVREDFENDVVWAASRSTILNPASTPYVNSQGVTWISNFYFASNDIATGNAGVGGSFGFYSTPHGNPDAESSDLICDVPDPKPDQCFQHDGFIGNSNSAGILYGVAGWINGTAGANVTLILNGVEADLGEAGNINSWTFIGVIDTAGFNVFEFRETNGTGGQLINIFADNVTLGVASAASHDTDGDGVTDLMDNCTEIPNPAQWDADSDGYGNNCDGDLNNTGGSVNFEDLALFNLAFGTNEASADLNSSGGAVNFEDLAIFKQLFGKAPGPSCCGTL